MHETFLSQSIRFYVQRDNVYLPARGESKMTYRMERELERQMFNAVFKE